MKTILLLIFSLFVLSMRPVAAQTTKTVGASGSDYSTLKAAFDAVNAGTLTGRIELQIKDNTTETASVVLYGSGTGSSSYTSLKIYPIVSGKSISGNLFNAPLIDLSGADSVTIDGRVNQSGSTPDLTIVNSNASGGQTATIRLQNDASDNLINYTILKGSATGLGIVNIAGTSGITGNDNNTISNSQITNEGGNRPVRAIISTGATGKENNNLVIRGNKFFDLINLNLSGGSTIIGISLNNEHATIAGNHFYETSTVSGSQNGVCSIISVSGSGSNHSVTGNFIGGSAPECGGSALEKSNASNNNFNGISMNGIPDESYIQGNTIRNISWSNSGQSTFYGILAENSNVRIGTDAGNIIGASDVTGSITFTGGAAGSLFTGIALLGNKEIILTGNSVGGITLNNQPSGDTDFYGIFCNTSAATRIKGNLIGSTTVSGSIQQTSVSTGSGNAQMCYGIYSTATGNVTIDSNTIANLSNGASTSSVYVTGTIRGILATSGTNSILFNTIRNLTFHNRSSATNANAPVIGISFNNHLNTTAQTIRGNTITGISNDHSESIGHVIGIYFSAGSTGHKIDRNFIRDVASSSSSGAKIFGISSTNGTNSYTNNLIALESANPLEITGIYSAAVSDNLYFNTVYIGGSPTNGSANSYALLGMNLTRNFRNNIFSNFRSNSGTANGTHYAISLAGNNNLTINYNNYFVSGSGTVLGVFQNANKTTLASWKSATGQDVNSLASNPLYASAGGSEPENYLPSESSLVAVTGTGTLRDFADSVRSLVYPAMGALEYTVSPCLNPTSAGIIGSSQNICFNAVPEPLTSITLPSGFNGMLEYQWQLSVDSVSFSNINAATNSAYSPGTLIQTTWYRRLSRVSCKDWSTAVSSNTVRVGVATAAIYSISGRAAYENNPHTGLDGLKILLRKGSAVIDSTLTGTGGYYRFDQLTGGSYGLILRSAAPGGQWQTWNGVNNTDYLLVSKHVAGTQLLPSEPPVVQISASVKLPHPLISNTDALAIRQAARYPATGYSFFDIPKWVFSGATAAARIDTFEVACGDVVRDIRGLCAGDVNGTHVPPAGFKTTASVQSHGRASLQLEHRGTLPLTDEIIFPVRVDRDMELGAMTLYLDFDPSVMIVTNVTTVTTITKGPELWYNLMEPPLTLNPSHLTTLQIGWMSPEPVSLAAGQAVIWVHARFRDGVETLHATSLPVAHPIRFTLNQNPLSELADGDGNVIDGAVLFIPDAGIADYTQTNGIVETHGRASLPLAITVYPNPAQSIVNIEFETINAVSGMLSLDLFNLQGMPVLSCKTLKAETGWNKHQLDLREMASGVYFLRARLNGETVYKKIVITR